MRSRAAIAQDDEHPDVEAVEPAAALAVERALRSARTGPIAEAGPEPAHGRRRGVARPASGATSARRDRAASRRRAAPTRRRRQRRSRRPRRRRATPPRPSAAPAATVAAAPATPGRRPGSAAGVESLVAGSAGAARVAGSSGERARRASSRSWRNAQPKTTRVWTIAIAPTPTASRIERRRRCPSQSEIAGVVRVVVVEDDVHVRERRGGGQDVGDPPAQRDGARGSRRSPRAGTGSARGRGSAGRRTPAPGRPGRRASSAGPGGARRPQDADDRRDQQHGARRRRPGTRRSRRRRSGQPHRVDGTAAASQIQQAGARRGCSPRVARRRAPTG